MEGYGLHEDGRGLSMDYVLFQLLAPARHMPKGRSAGAGTCLKPFV